MSRRGKIVCTLGPATNSDELILAAERELGIGRGETSPDGSFHLEIIHCFGHCTMGPNVAVDEQMTHHVTPDMMRNMLRGSAPQ